MKILTEETHRCDREQCRVETYVVRPHGPRACPACYHAGERPVPQKPEESPQSEKKCNSIGLIDCHSKNVKCEHCPLIKRMNGLD